MGSNVPHVAFAHATCGAEPVLRAVVIRSIDTKSSKRRKIFLVIVSPLFKKVEVNGRLSREP